MSKKPVLKLENICKDYYQGRSVIEVLKDINLEVFPGEMVAVVGASGSGKSTLLHIAGLLDKADSGSVTIADLSANEIQDARKAAKIRLENIGFIYQFHHLLGDFTARENVAMPLIIAGQKRKDALGQAEELLEKVGLGSRLWNLPGELSGGEMQRVAIARSLINKPKLILADEPTGNLDPHTAEEIFDLFMSTAAGQGAAIVMVTHNLGLAERMNRTIRLD